MSMKDAAFSVVDDAATAAPSPLRIIDPTQWQGQPVPEREWIAPDFIPAGTVSLLSGEGAGGRSHGR